MNALEQTFGGQFAQIAADGVFRDAEFTAQILGDDGAGMAESFEDVFSTVAGEHSSTMAQF